VLALGHKPWPPPRDGLGADVSCNIDEPSLAGEAVGVAAHMHALEHSPRVLGNMQTSRDARVGENTLEPPT
jgi:hypothetical protein